MPLKCRNLTSPLVDNPKITGVIGFQNALALVRTASMFTSAAALALR